MVSCEGHHGVFVYADHTGLEQISGQIGQFLEHCAVQGVLRSQAVGGWTPAADDDQAQGGVQGGARLVSVMEGVSGSAPKTGYVSLEAQNHVKLSGYLYNLIFTGVEDTGL